MVALSVIVIGSAKSALIDSSIPEVKFGNISGSKNYIQDAGIKMCFAYFAGLEAEKRKAEFGKQLNVLGAVGKINPLGSGRKAITRGNMRLSLPKRMPGKNLG